MQYLKMSFTTLVVILFAAAAVACGAALQCNDVTQLMTPCMPYLTGPPALSPYGPCCSGITMLNRLAPAAAERAAICSCLKAAAASFPAVDFARAAGLPRLCGVPLNFTISPAIDCTRASGSHIPEKLGL